VKSDKVYLVGFMGAGKTSVARALGRRLDWRVEDIDEAIEAKERRRVATIFADEGEPFFRALEREALRAVLPLRHAVVATGGGTFVDPENRAMMRADGACIWLDVTLEQAIGRVPADGSRPLAADRQQFEDLYYARRAAYQQAHLRIDVSRVPIDETVERILDWLGY
jgi:shikimate kinase